MDACPKCSGTSGYGYDLTITHFMSGVWGQSATAGDATKAGQSLVECLDCGAKFQFGALIEKGAIQ